METLRQVTGTKKILRLNDFICRQCRVQATRDEDHICGICKAIGMKAGPGPENISWRDILLSSEISRGIFLWFKRARPAIFGYPAGKAV
jgi:hypothetical protein